MIDIKQFSKAFTADFIEVYKSYPCLWKIKSTDYKDRNKKQAAYTVLLKKLQEVEPNATKKSVTAKINSIRGAFRREIKKVEESRRSGAGADEVYVPHLWYYNLLLFTKDQEIPRESVSNIAENCEEKSDGESENTQEREYVDHDVESLLSPSPRCSSAISDRNKPINSPSTSSHISSATSKSSQRKGKTIVDEQADEILTMVGERLHNNTTNNEDAFNIAVKLRTLPRQTKLYTEKLINDLLFEAEMGNVDQNTKIVTSANNPTYTYQHNSPYLQSNEYSHPATYPAIDHQHQANNASTLFETYTPFTIVYLGGIGFLIVPSLCISIIGFMFEGKDLIKFCSIFYLLLYLFILLYLYYQYY